MNRHSGSHLLISTTISHSSSFISSFLVSFFLVSRFSSVLWYVFFSFSCFIFYTYTFVCFWLLLRLSPCEIMIRPRIQCIHKRRKIEMKRIRKAQIKNTFNSFTHAHIHTHSLVLHKISTENW